MNWTLAPDITESAIGREIVATMADGIEEFMKENSIPISSEGFERVVELSRQTGERGLIALRQKLLFDRLQNVLSRGVGSFVPAAMTDVHSVTSASQIHARLRKLGLEIDEDGNLTPPSEEIKQRIIADLGMEIWILIEIFLRRDCQRRLVFDELKRRHPTQSAKNTDTL